MPFSLSSLIHGTSQWDGFGSAKNFVYKDSSGGQIPPNKIYLALAYLPVTPLSYSLNSLEGGYIGDCIRDCYRCY